MKNPKFLRWIFFLTFIAILVLHQSALRAAQEESITTQKITSSLSMLQGPGGNIGLSVGEDGPFMIDDKFAPLSEKIAAEIKKQTDRPVKFLLNTHWHGDHTGGNENFGKAGAVIVAHENVRKRMSVDEFMEDFGAPRPASPEKALPVITFTEKVSFHWNGEEIQIYHVKNAHTDGDAVVHFVKSNVFHLGDVYFNGNYPYIDHGHGGSISGTIAAVDFVQSLGMNEQTKIIPGHGELSNLKELREYREMLETVRGRLQKLIAEGKSEDEIVAAQPTKDLDAKWGKGFMKPEPWVRIVLKGMKKPKDG